LKLLNLYSIRFITDLMVEQRKVKYGLIISSSEKAEKIERYENLSLISVPYPGVEFFKSYKDNFYNGAGVHFDWNQLGIDALLSTLPKVVQNSPILKNIKWEEYKSWDLILLTQNYIKIFLSLIALPNSDGILIHCISGWDRTPLMISVLRLSLWADGEIHKSLSASEILYLTIAYDWLLFSHYLADRKQRGEDIYFFCFDFLKHIKSCEFSITKLKNNINSSKTASTDKGLNENLPSLESSSSSWNWVENNPSIETDQERVRAVKLDLVYDEFIRLTSTLFDKSEESQSVWDWIFKQ
jgi:myotubularin-related protein 14